MRRGEGEGASPGSRGRRVVAALALALGVLLAIEGLLQLASLASARVARALSPGVPLTLPDARLGTRGNPAVPDHDEQGWRNPRRLARAEQVAIGDSQTYGAEVTREQAWPLRLAAHTGRSTYSLALGGYGPVQYLRLMDDALALEPARVLIGLYAGNDLADAYLAVDRQGLADELRPDAATQAALAAAEAQRGELAAAWLATGAARRGALKQALRRGLDPIESHSRLFGLLSGLTRLTRPPTAAPGAHRWKPWPEYARRVADLDPALLLPVAAGDSGTILTPAARAAVLDPRDPRVAEGLRISLAALEAAIRACHGRCRLVVVAIPTKELVFAEAVRAHVPRPPPVYQALVADEQALWQQLRDFLEGRGVAFVDALPALRAAVADGRQPYPPDWNGHPDAAGNEAIARAVAEALDRSG